MSTSLKYEKELMMVKISVALVVIFTTISTLASDESIRPFNSSRDIYWNMLIGEDYDRLEKESNNAREKSLTVADGQPLLATFYAGVSGCITSGCRDELSENDWKLRLEKLKEWVTLHPNSNTAKVALASYYLELGWAIRGNGSIRTVNRQAYGSFREYLEKSRVELYKFKNEGITDPGWYTSLLRIARSEGWPRETFESIYTEAVSKFPKYIPLYFEMATYLAPRWHGSIVDLKTYINSVTNSTRSIMGDTLYARLNWLMSSGNMFKNGQTDWGKMKKGFERINKDYPHRWNLNNFAKFSCLARDMNTFEELNTKINGKPILAAFWGKRNNYNICVNRIHLNKK